MKNPIVYEGWCGEAHITQFRKSWGEFDIAKTPILHKQKGKIHQWLPHEWPPMKVRITVEIIE